MEIGPEKPAIEVVPAADPFEVERPRPTPVETPTPVEAPVEEPAGV